MVKNWSITVHLTSMSCLRSPDGQFTWRMGGAHMLCHGTVCHVIIPLHGDQATNNLDLSSQLTYRQGRRMEGGEWAWERDGWMNGTEISWLEKDGRQEGLGQWHCHTWAEHPATSGSTWDLSHQATSRRTGAGITAWLTSQEDDTANTTPPWRHSCSPMITVGILY